MKPRGFTLLELLLASVLTLLVMLAAYSAFFMGKNSYRSIEQRAERIQATRVFLARIAKDLRNSFAFSPTDSRFKGAKTEMEFFTLRDLYNGTSSVRAVSLAGFRFENSAVSLRYCDNSLALDTAHAPGYNVLIDNVTDCAFSYGAFNAPSKTMQWKDSWNDPLSFPAAVRVAVTGIRADVPLAYDIYLANEN